VEVLFVFYQGERLGDLVLYLLFRAGVQVDIVDLLGK
jgi:hypothetical protein